MKETRMQVVFGVMGYGLLFVGLQTGLNPIDFTLLTLMLYTFVLYLVLHEDFLSIEKKTEQSEVKRSVNLIDQIELMRSDFNQSLNDLENWADIQKCERDDAVNFICSLNSKYDLPELRDYVYALKCRQTLKHVAAVQFLPCSNMDAWYE